MQTSFNNLFDVENIVNFYIMGSSSLLACHYSKQYKTLTIENNINQLSDHLALVQKYEILKLIRSKNNNRY